MIEFPNQPDFPDQHTAVAVGRYFGGIKLGAAGLIF